MNCLEDEDKPVGGGGGTASRGSLEFVQNLNAEEMCSTNQNPTRLSKCWYLEIYLFSAILDLTSHRLRKFLC